MARGLIGTALLCTLCCHRNPGIGYKPVVTLAPAAAATGGSPVRPPVCSNIMLPAYPDRALGQHTESVDVQSIFS